MSYALANSAFPHERTSDQWFSESQFESYRSLGFYIADGLITDTVKRLNYPKKVSLEDLFGAFMLNAAGSFIEFSHPKRNRRYPSEHHVPDDPLD